MLALAIDRYVKLHILYRVSNFRVLSKSSFNSSPPPLQTLPSQFFTSHMASSHLIMSNILVNTTTTSVI